MAGLVFYASLALLGAGLGALLVYAVSQLVWHLVTGSGEERWLALLGLLLVVMMVSMLVYVATSG